MLIEGVYNYNIVIISILVAIIATFQSLHIIEKIAYAVGKARYFWLITGSFVMGGGIWASHYIGILSFEVPIETTHDVPLTIMSIFVSMFSFLLAFYFTMPQHIKRYKFILSSVIVGSGIIGMHFIGMTAINIPADIVQNETLVTLSIIIAYVVSFITLKVFITFRNENISLRLKWLAAILIGMMMYIPHTIGLSATSFYADESVITTNTLDSFVLYSIIFMISFVMLNSWGALVFDRHVLSKMAFKDPLTGLSNRNEMGRYFEQIRKNKKIALLFLDLDQFKSINDQYGHDIGDALIQEVALRLQDFIKQTQFVYRIGGDEFLVVVETNHLSSVQKIADEILTRIKEPYIVEDHHLSITVSMGVVIDEANKGNTSDLLKKADIAMYRSKRYGKNQYCIYNQVMDKEVYRKTQLEQDVSFAIEKGEFYLVYQPKWNVKTESVVGFEALLRWDHADLGVISPGEFIPIAERNRSIIPITVWVLEQAASQNKIWVDQGYDQTISVNFSALLFELDDLCEQVKKILNKTKLAPSLLEIEITESMVFNNIEKVTVKLERLRKIGIKISMDDFGTGYSSIGILDRIPFDVLKLDRSFIWDIETSKKRSIIRAIITMANSLNLKVVAEGVEEKAHIDYLIEMGCNIMQGYYYAKPMRVENVEKWLQENVRLERESIEV